MSIVIDHVGIPAADPWASARFLREILAAGRRAAIRAPLEQHRAVVGSLRCVSRTIRTSRGVAFRWPVLARR
jgi:hypothetical protein